MFLDKVLLYDKVYYSIGQWDLKDSLDRSTTMRILCNKHQMSTWGVGLLKDIVYLNLAVF